MGLLALSVIVMSCTNGTLAGEATRTADARQCPNGCDIIKNMNRAAMIEYASETVKSCNEVCTDNAKVCIDAEMGVPHAIRSTDGTVTDEFIGWSMADCGTGVSHLLRCRCY